MILDIIFSALKRKYISDLHLTVGEPIWLRENGDLVKLPVEDPAGNPVEGEELILDDDIIQEVLLQLNTEIGQKARSLLAAKELENSGAEKRTGLDFAATFKDIRVRVNVSLANGSKLSIVLRKLNEVIPTFETLGLPLEIMTQALRPSGLILVTGPTGSGKSTTLATILNQINLTEPKHIVTIEDPVEYPLLSAKSKITRKEIGIDGPNFPSILRASMRQDPDIMMVGEIRDIETVRMAFSAAETGHLVFATLHTNSAVKTIDRITSFFPGDEKDWASNVLSTVLNCIVSQALIPKVGGDGRALAYEILLNGPDVADSIKTQKVINIEQTMDTGRQKGHVLMRHRLAELVKNNVISIENGLRAAPDRAKAETYFTSQGIRKT